MKLNLQPHGSALRSVVGDTSPGCSIRWSYEEGVSLTAILGFASLMLDKWHLLSEQEKYGYLEAVDRQSRRLARLVEGLLIGSRIDAGVLPVDPKWITLATAIDEVLRTLGTAPRR